MSDMHQSPDFEFDPHGAHDSESFDGSLFGSELLSPDEANRLASGPGRLVVWLGEQGTGKTSISIELYERQRRPGAQTQFAGSWTLLAFEQRAHQRRRTGAPPAATRADLDPEGHEILHLALSTGEAPVHLLIADLPGEVFRRLADNQLAADEIPWLGRADKLAILIDGAHLCDAAARSSTLTRARQLAERLRSGGLPRRGTGLALVVTKWDLVRADPEAIAYWSEREPELLGELRALDADAVALHTAAASSPAPDGVAAIRAWLLDIPAPADQLESTGGGPSTETTQLPAVSSTVDGVHSTSANALAEDAKRPDADPAAHEVPSAWHTLLDDAHSTARPDTPAGDALSFDVGVSQDETLAAETAPSAAEAYAADVSARVDEMPASEASSHVDEMPAAEARWHVDEMPAAEARWHLDEMPATEADPATSEAEEDAGVPAPLDTPPADVGSPGEDPGPRAEGPPADEVNLTDANGAGDDAGPADEGPPTEESQTIEWGTPAEESTSSEALPSATVAHFAWPEEPRRRRWLPWRRRR
jgi:hypothetical protein